MIHLFYVLLLVVCIHAEHDSGLTSVPYSMANGSDILCVVSRVLNLDRFCLVFIPVTAFSNTVTIINYYLLDISTQLTTLRVWLFVMMDQCKMISCTKKCLLK